MTTNRALDFCFKFPNIVCLVSILWCSCSQNESPNTQIQNPEYFLLNQLEKSPEFPGGYSNFKSYINKRIKESPSDLFREIEGTVLIDFLINEHGIVKNVVVRTPLPLKIENALVKIITESPTWTAGMIQGRSVPSLQTLPIRF